MKASQLDLIGAAKAGAEALERKHPDVSFTSGRRGVADQARAMASNVVKNRHWIAETYSNTAESRSLQVWVSANPQADTQAEIAAGLQAIMAKWSDAQKSRLSKHFSGEAWDVQPVGGPKGVAIKASIRALPGLVKFLEKEGGLVRWHCQF